MLAAEPVRRQISPSLRPAMSFPARRGALGLLLAAREDRPDDDDDDPELLLLLLLQLDESLLSELESRRLLLPRRLRSFRRCRFSSFLSFLRRSRALFFNSSAPVTSQTSTIFHTFRAQALGSASLSAAWFLSSCSSALHDLIVYLVAPGRRVVLRAADAVRTFHLTLSLALSLCPLLSPGPYAGCVPDGSAALPLLSPPAPCAPCPARRSSFYSDAQSSKAASDWGCKSSTLGTSMPHAGPGPYGKGVSVRHEVLAHQAHPQPAIEDDRQLGHVEARRPDPAVDPHVEHGAAPL